MYNISRLKFLITLNNVKFNNFETWSFNIGKYDLEICLLHIIFSQIEKSIQI